MEKDNNIKEDKNQRHLYLAEALFALSLMIWYFVGWMFVKGFWGVCFALIFPPYPLYKAVEYLVTRI